MQLALKAVQNEAAYDLLSKLMRNIVSTRSPLRASRSVFSWRPWRPRLRLLRFRWCHVDNACLARLITKDVQSSGAIGADGAGLGQSAPFSAYPPRRIVDSRDPLDSSCQVL